MKKYFYLFLAGAVILVSAAAAEAREITFGVRGGLNISNITGDDAEFSEVIVDDFGDPVVTLDFSPDSVTGIAIGGFVNIPLSETFSLQPEIIYSPKGAKYSVTESAVDAGTGITYTIDGELELKLVYLEIPVLARLDIPMEGQIRPNIYAGPSLGLNLSAESTSRATYSANGVVFDEETETDDLKNDVNSVDLGLVIGGGVEYGNFTLDVRYTMSLSTIYQETQFEGVTEQSDIKNSVISIMAGYRF